MKHIEIYFLGAMLFIAPYTQVLAGGVDDGRMLSSQCFQCHGTNATGMEELAGKSYSELSEELLDLKYSDDTPAKIMHMQARGYTDQQLKDIAYYISLLPAP
jgi:cytochrome c553